MKCVKCATENIQEAKFCVECGEVLLVTQNENVSADNANANNANVNPATSVISGGGGMNKGLFNIIAGIVGVILVIGIIFYFVTKVNITPGKTAAMKSKAEMIFVDFEKQYGTQPEFESIKKQFVTTNQLFQYKDWTEAYHQYEEIIDLCRDGKNDVQDRLDEEEAERQRIAKIEINKLSKIKNNLGMQFVGVESGSFQMGSNDGDSDEKPVHKVSLTNNFAIGKYEVMQSEYQKIMGNNPSNWENSNKPVERVSWNDAVEFCQKLTSREKNAGRLPNGYEYRLPTEAEWEYAARGGDKSRGYKYSGSNSIASVAWYDDNSGSKTHPVGQKSSNELGIYDMSGNVWEWCYDWKGSYSSNSVTNPKGASSSKYRVSRGGSWGYSAGGCRSAVRSWNDPSDTFSDLGFRVLLAQE